MVSVATAALLAVWLGPALQTDDAAVPAIAITQGVSDVAVLLPSIEYTSAPSVPVEPPHSRTLAMRTWLHRAMRAVHAEAAPAAPRPAPALQIEDTGVPVIAVTQGVGNVAALVPSIERTSVPDVPADASAVPSHSLTLAMRAWMHRAMQAVHAEPSVVPDGLTIDQEPIVRKSSADERPRALVPLYASLVTLQILDMHSTSVALNGAGREANPIMRPVVGNQAAFVMAKVGATTAMIWATERMWHRNRLAAIGLMAGMTGMMGLVDTHNYTVLH